MSEDELQIERAKLAFEERKERNVSLRFLIGVVALGIATQSVDSVLDQEKSRQELIARDKHLAVQLLVDMENLAHDQQRKRIQRFQKVSLSPEIQKPLDEFLVEVEEEQLRMEREAAKELTRLAADELKRAELEAEERRRAEQAAIAAERERSRAEEKRRQYQAMVASIRGIKP